jgi:hypothetical protein
MESLGHYSQQGIQILAIFASRQSFKTLVVGTTGIGVGGGNRGVWVVDGWRCGAEALGTVSDGNEGVRGSDSVDHLALLVELVNIGTILVTDPE